MYVTRKARSGRSNRAERSAQALVLIGCCGIEIQCRCEGGAGPRGGRPRLAYPRQGNRQVEVLTKRPLNNLHEHGIVEARPPLIKRRRRLRCLRRNNLRGVVEWSQVRVRLLVVWPHCTGRQSKAERRAHAGSTEFR